MSCVLKRLFLDQNAASVRVVIAPWGRIVPLDLRIQDVQSRSLSTHLLLLLPRGHAVLGARTRAAARGCQHHGADMKSSFVMCSVLCLFGTSAISANGIPTALMTGYSGSCVLAVTGKIDKKRLRLELG